MRGFTGVQDGRTPVEDFLDSLPGKVAQKVLWVLMVAEELDTLPTTYFKKMVGSDDIWGVPETSSVRTITGSSVSMPAARCWCSRMAL